MKIINYLILAVAAIAMASCNSLSNDPVKDQFLDIVTLDASNDNGSVLTFRVEDNDPLVTLTTSQKFSKDQVGKRIVVLYEGMGEDYKHGTSGQVKLLAAAPTLGGGAAIQPAVADTLSNWASDVIDYIQPYRSGQYLNLPLQIYTSADPRKFACYYDPNTLDNEYPELHIILKRTSGYDSTIPTTFYGSYDISYIWNRTNVKGITIHYNSNSGEKSVSIPKKDDTLRPQE